MQKSGELKKPLQAGTLRKDQPRLCTCPLPTSLSAGYPQKDDLCPIHGLPQFRGGK